MGSQKFYYLMVALSVFVTAEETSERDKRAVGRRPIVTNHDLNIAVKVAEDFVSRLQRLEGNLAGTGIQVREDSPSHGQLIDSYPAAEALMIGRNALIANRASLYLVQRHCRKSNIPLSDCVESLSKWSFSVTPLGDKCDAQFGAVKCTATYPYRSFDGSCNHLIHPSWGQSNTAYGRLLPAQYSDGISEPKKSSSRRPLPSSRFISNILIADSDKPEKEKTLALAQWTQFIGNDLFHTAVTKMVHTGSPIECCRYDGKNLSPRYVHPECQQISIPSDDPDYAPHRTVCMNYVRSLTSFRHGCNFGPADQLNQATHYLDGSMIYGTSSAKSISLRTLVGGKLATSTKDNVEFLSMSDAPEDHCQVTNGESICYKSGDPRVNQHPHHTAMYTIWVREHNRIATALANINPYWDDETLFQETRKIVIAEIQHITYKYWVQFVLGEAYTRSVKLDIKPKGFSNNFNEDENPSITNGFATVGFRFVNSMMQSKLKLYDKEGKQNDTLYLKDHFNKPAILQEPGVFEQLLRGLSIETSQKLDPYMVEDLTSLLFRGSSAIGQDIMSLDIQRGRDHGIPGYNQFRKHCKLPSSDKFETLLDTVPQSILNKMKIVYDHPDDIDLIVGAVAEVPAEDSILGPTLRCIIGEQMLRTKNGDRFFYDIVGKPHSFKESQINEIKKASLARIICDSVKSIDKIQVDVFKVPSNKNPFVSCDDSRIPKLNLNEWKSIT